VNLPRVSQLPSVGKNSTITSTLRVIRNRQEQNMKGLRLFERREHSRGVSRLREIYRQYTQSKSKYLERGELCAKRGWPDRGRELHKSFRLQHAFNELEALRFEYLVSSGVFRSGEWKSLESIFERIHTGWGSGEEQALLERPELSKFIRGNCDAAKGKRLPAARRSASSDPAR
jgi:hypothetical protein